MAIKIVTEFESSVTNENEDIYSKSYIENKATIIEFDTRKRNYKKVFNIRSNISWDKEVYTIDIREISTYLNQVVYRFIFSKGYYRDQNNKRIFFTPEINEISTSQHVSKSVIWLSCYLAVICGVSLRNIAHLFTHLFLVSVTKSSIDRWISQIGENLPSEEEILKRLITVKGKSVTECNIDGYYPLGTNACVMVVKDEYDRILITHEAESENKEDAIKFLKKLKKAGIEITKAYSDYSSSYISAIKEVFTDVVFQADHFHTVKNIWKKLKKAFLEFRRDKKSSIETTEDSYEKENLEEFAKKLWEYRWIILKKPCNLSKSERREIHKLEKLDKDGFIKKLRGIIRNIVSIFDKSKTEKSAKDKLKRLRKKVLLENNNHYSGIINFMTKNWNEATQYLRTENVKRSSNSESGMRFLRRLEKNHDGLRTEKTRKTYIKIYQMIKYLSNEDITKFIDNRVLKL